MFLKPRLKKALEFLGKNYSVKKIDLEDCIYRNLGNGFDIEVSGINLRGSKNICSFVCVWDVSKGLNQSARSVEYVRNISTLAVLKSELERLAIKYGPRVKD